MWVLLCLLLLGLDVAVVSLGWCLVFLVMFWIRGWDHCLLVVAAVLPLAVLCFPGLCRFYPLHFF